MSKNRELFDREKTPSGRLMLVDGMAIIYRAHFALINSPRYTSTGQCTSAVFGFCNTLFDLIKREEPTHLAVAFDTDEPTHRHVAFEQYKAQREEMPEELAEQIPWVFQLLEAMYVPILRYPGWEADDVLGTLARRAEGDGFETLLVTPDKDYHQLVSSQTRVWKPGRKGSQFEILGVSEVLERWKVKRVEQVVDILGLMGDSSDNVPGVPGIGEKTAQKLIAEYDSIENLLDHTAEIKGKRGQTLESYADQARLSKELVTIATDAPVEVSWDDLKVEAWNNKALKKLFADLEFRTLAKRIFGEDALKQDESAEPLRDGAGQGLLFDETTQEVTLQDVAHTYHTVETLEGRRELLGKLLEAPVVCFDLESTGLDPRTATPLGIAFSIKPHEAYYVVCPTDDASARDVLREFTPLFEDARVELVGHNLKYDVSLLRWSGIHVTAKLFDTMLIHTMIEPEMKHGMDVLAQQYLRYQPIALRTLLGDPPEREMTEIPLAQLAEYAAEDADVTFQLSERLRQEVESREMQRVCYDVECPLVAVLVEMEYEGIRLDTDSLRAYSAQLEADISQLRERIFSAAGHEFNIDSPKQLGVVLYEELKVEENPKKTATGQYSTREAELVRLSGRHEIIRDVLDYRNAAKLKSVYVDQLPAAVNPETGRVHTHYNQSWTATGRMQSNDPNLQTIPVRKERGREIRAAFVPRDPDFAILSADYSQVELRIMASLSQDEGMLEAFRSNTDIHAATAAKVYHVDLDDVTRRMRDSAKTVNFGIIYGISAFGLQQRLNIPRDEAAQLIDSYFEKYPGVRNYIDRTIEFAREHGYVQTLTGRRRYLRDINSRNYSLRSTAERLAMNSPIQGTAADLLKLAMIRVHQLLSSGPYRTRMLLTVHDELVFDLARDEADELMPRIQHAMQEAMVLDVPLVVEMGVGSNWLEAH